MYVLSTWPMVPSEVVYEDDIDGDGELESVSLPLWATSNKGTCTAQAFFVQLGLGGPMCNLGLAIYYLLVIKHGWKDARLRKNFERWMHSCVAVVAFGLAIAGIILQLYNDANSWCWIAPKNAPSNNNNNADVYRWAFFYAELWLCIVCITGIMIAIVVHVARTETKTE